MLLINMYVIKYCLFLNYLILIFAKIQKIKLVIIITIKNISLYNLFLHLSELPQISKTLFIFNGGNPFFLSFYLFLLYHLAVCKIKYIFTQPHFYPIFSYLVYPNCYGEYTAFPHNKRTSRIFPYSI